MRASWFGTDLRVLISTLVSILILSRVCLYILPTFSFSLCLLHCHIDNFTMWSISCGILRWDHHRIREIMDPIENSWSRVWLLSPMWFELLFLRRKSECLFRHMRNNLSYEVIFLFGCEVWGYSWGWKSRGQSDGCNEYLSGFSSLSLPNLHPFRF